MGSVQTILLELATNIVNIVSDPIFIVLAILIIYMYKREVRDSKDTHYKNKVERTAVKDLFRGVIIGASVSLILTDIGISIPITKGMLILIPITIGLVFINPKWGCFSYVLPIAYGIQVVSRVFQKDLSFINLNYEKMIILIGVLHIIEGLLVGAYGHENSRATPLYKDGKLIQGHILRKYWLIPLMIFQYGRSTVTLLPIYAVLGYADVALVNNPNKKSKTTGAILVMYGISITFLGYLTQREIISVLLVILLMPILHESMFLINYKEIGTYK